MKKFLNVTAIFCTAFMLAACGSKSPEAVTETFLKALMNGNFQEAAMYATSETVPVLEQMAKMVSEDELKEIIDEFKGTTLKVIGEEVNENEATVMLELATADGAIDTASYSLAKEDGAWKVDFKK